MTMHPTTFDPITSAIRPLDPKLVERLALLLADPPRLPGETTFRSLGQILRDMAGVD